METAEFIETLRVEGDLLARAAEQAGWDDEVRTCPGWRLRDLVGHVGNVHRWATGFVAGATEPARPTDTRPGDEELAAWFREGHRALVDELTAAPADRTCWTFMAAPSPMAFWARRQAHETAVHRVDAESAVRDGSFSPMAADFALDGIDELLCGFHTASRSKVRSEVPRTLRIRAAGGPPDGRDWLLRLSRDPMTVEPGVAGNADCTVTGPADALYLMLWNRPGHNRTEVTGDASVLELWRRTSTI